MATMTMDRAKLILSFVVQWHQLERKQCGLVEWVALKLSCHRRAAEACIDKARDIVTPPLWDAAITQVQAGQLVEPVRPEPPKTPLIERLKVIERENHELVAFVKWMEGTGRLMNPGGRSHEEIVAAYRGIDLVAVGAERRAIEQYAADMQNYWRLKDEADAARGRR